MVDVRRIRIGNQSASSASSIAEPFSYAVDNGFDAFEWFPDRKENGAGWEESNVTKEMRIWIKETAGRHDIALSVHAPLHLNPLVPDADRRLEETAAFAEEINARLLNIHLHADRGIDEFVMVIAPFVKHAARRGLRISIENTPDTTPGQLNELFKKFRALHPVEVAHVGMCLDVGHANLCNVTRNDYLKFVDLLDSEVPITHIHLHENYGDHDSHLTLFTGPSGQNPAGILGLIHRMKQRNFSGSIILEQWPQPAHLLKDARDRLRALFLDVSPSPLSSTPSGGDACIDAIVNANRKYHSWRRRLEWFHDFLVTGDEVTEEKLAYLAIYLRFIGTGEVPCAEDGGHYRPSHHAKTSGEIASALRTLTTPENAFVIRKIYPWLPSSSSRFTREEPLTRIRDIAHRNDIPRELKREIKTTLQNKLHRSAGPEDLVTSEELLERITNPHAGYSPAFVEEFRRFHEELKEFFSARSLDEDLVALSGRADTRLGDLIHRFLDLKAKVVTTQQRVELLDILTQVRSALHEKSEQSPDADGQEARQIDIKLEGFAFAVLSEVINHLSASGGFSWLAAVHALTLAVANVRLTGICPEECSAIENELQFESRNDGASDRDWLLLVNATVARSARLAELYAARILSVFPEKVEKLGRALGVDEQARKTYAEADIRGNLVFQVSRLAEVIRGEVRSSAGLPPWEVIVPGKTTGQLIAVRSVQDVPGDRLQPLLVLLDEPEGDEMLPESAAGVISGREVPHLSHLAIRARQRGITFVVCEDKHLYEDLKRHTGENMVLDTSAEKVLIRETPSTVAGVSARSYGRPVPVVPPDVMLSTSQTALDLGAVTMESGGSKAVGMRTLTELAQSTASDFRTPASLVIPFGVMEQSLHAVAEVETEYAALVRQLGRLPEPEFGDVLGRIRSLILRLPVPSWISVAVAERIGRDTPLMIRSSTNAEDLDDFAGAGLYASYTSASLNDIAQGVRQVWSSLWTTRATASRVEAGIPHTTVHMALLIQELIEPELSCIMHTTNPVSHDHDELYIELAAGLGDVLSSGGIPGTPFRLAYDKKHDSVKMLSSASFSEEVIPGTLGGVTRQVVDYSRVRFSTDRDYRREIGTRLGRIGKRLESLKSVPQDIEGAIVGDTIYLVQSRTQQGITL